MMLFATTSHAWKPTRDYVFLPGDVNLDGDITLADAELVLTYVLYPSTPLSIPQLMNADVSGYDGITAYDASLILRMIPTPVGVNKISKLPTNLATIKKLHR